MKHARPLAAALGAGALLTGAFVAGSTGGAADHLEAPLVRGNPQTDINDVYAFVNPQNPANTVLIMTVNPAAGILSPTTFDPEGQYQFQIDNDGDVKPDEAITVTFGEVAGGRQSVKVKGPDDTARGWTGDTIELDDGGAATAGVFEDPFFFDLEAFLVTTGRPPFFGANGGFCTTDPAPDFFAGLDVSAIVVEVPSEDLLGVDGSSTINVWGETKNASGRVDRMGKPAIATVLINDGNENAYNATKPKDHVRMWADEVSNNLQVLSGLDGNGYDEATADAVARVLLPDVLTLDTASTEGFVPGLNGRRLADDVIDFELAVVTGLLDSDGHPPVLTTDCVDANDRAFPAGFPYLAPAHQG